MGAEKMIEGFVIMLLAIILILGVLTPVTESIIAAGSFTGMIATVLNIIPILLATGAFMIITGYYSTQI